MNTDPCSQLHDADFKDEDWFVERCASSLNDLVSPDAAEKKFEVSVIVGIPTTGDERPDPDEAREDIQPGLVRIYGASQVENIRGTPTNPNVVMTTIAAVVITEDNPCAALRDEDEKDDGWSLASCKGEYLAQDSQDRAVWTLEVSAQTPPPFVMGTTPLHEFSILAYYLFGNNNVGNIVDTSLTSDDAVFVEFSVRVLSGIEPCNILGEDDFYDDSYIILDCKTVYNENDVRQATTGRVGFPAGRDVSRIGEDGRQVMSRLFGVGGFTDFTAKVSSVKKVQTVEANAPDAINIEATIGTAEDPCIDIENEDTDDLFISCSSQQSTQGNQMWEVRTTSLLEQGGDSAELVQTATELFQKAVGVQNVISVNGKQLVAPPDDDDTPVAVHGNWGEWGPYSPCSVSCGVGQQTRKRQCNNPAPSDGGDQCDGSDTGKKKCTQPACPECTHEDETIACSKIKKKWANNQFATCDVNSGLWDRSPCQTECSVGDKPRACKKLSAGWKGKVPCHESGVWDRTQCKGKGTPECLDGTTISCKKVSKKKPGGEAKCQTGKWDKTACEKCKCKKDGQTKSCKKVDPLNFIGSGAASCDGCSWDFSACTPNPCPGTKKPQCTPGTTDQCQGNVNGATGGTATCSSKCKWNKSTCTF
eukprot:TRINITY_DN6100_c0_g1_i1.p1 TRINITY_DN6100_c0_g1~~TRINITY_DN6100_c0_g1_i1.p1  ORF type:complete len:683 (+),score=94.83 TRINITY_DN6100_c0_g1_i1:114-2051(+)